MKLQEASLLEKKKAFSEAAELRKDALKIYSARAKPCGSTMKKQLELLIKDLERSKNKEEAAKYKVQLAACPSEKK